MSKKYLDRVIAFTMVIVLVLSLIVIDNRLSSSAKSENKKATSTDAKASLFDDDETPPTITVDSGFDNTAYYNSLEGIVTAADDEGLTSVSIILVTYVTEEDSNELKELTSTLYTETTSDTSYDFGAADSCLSDLSDGANILRFTATSGGGTTTSNDITFNYDGTNPETTITMDDDDISDASSVVITTDGTSITVSLSDATSGIDTDASSVTLVNKSDETSETLAIDENGTASKTFTSSDNGGYSLKVVAVDNAGNSVTSSTTVNVDIGSISSYLVLTTGGSTVYDSAVYNEVYTNASSAVVEYVVVAYGLDPDADVTATVTKTSASGTSTAVTVTPTSETDDQKGVTTLTYTYPLSENYSYSFSMKAYKHFDKNESVTESMTVVYDTEGPSASISFNDYSKYLNGVYYYSGTPSITVTGEDNFSLSDYTITDGSGNVVASGTMSGTSSSKTLNLTSGISNNTVYTITLVIKDTTGNSSTQVSYKFAIDTTKPTVTASVDSYYNSSATTVSATASDNFYVTSFTAVATCDGEALTDQTVNVTAATSASTTFKYSKEGTYSVTVYAYDEAGNCATSTVTFTIDSSAPTVKISGVPSNHLTTGTTVKITITDDAAITTDMFTVTMFYKIYDAVEYSSKVLTLTQKNSTTLTVSQSCQEISGSAAQYYFTITGTDLSGNSVSYSIDDTRLKVDSTPPEIEITDDPEDTNDGYYNSSVTAKFTVYEQFTNKTTIKVSDANKSTNGDADETYTQKALEESYKIKRTDEGKYKLTIYAEDAFGNDASETITFVIDKTAPTISLSSVNSINNSSVSLNVTLADNFKGEKYTIHVTRKDANGSTAYDADYDTGKWASTSKTIPLTFTEEGDYEITVSATDKAGNVATTQTTSFRIDKTAPVLSITGVEDSQTESCTATLTMTEAFGFTYGTTSLSSDSITATITKKVDGSSETTIATLNASNFTGSSPYTTTYTFSEDGEYTITFSATDLAGNTATTVSKTFIVDKTAPELLVTAVDSASSNVTSYQVVGAADEANADYVDMTISIVETFFASNNVSIVVKKDGTDVSSQFFSTFKSMSTTSKASQRFTEDGVYTVEISAVDALGNASESYSLVFTIDNTAPTVDATSKLTSFQGKDVLNASDFADILNSGYDALWTVNDTSIFDVVVKLDGVDFVDFSDLTDGYHTMTITVTDEVGHVTTDEFSFTYDGTAPRIIITGIDDGETTYESFTLKISLEDDDDTITSISINGTEVASSAYESTNTYEFQVTDYGTYEILVTATDAAGNIASTYDSETGETFTFKYVNKTTLIIYIIIAIVSALLILFLLILLIARRRKNKK